MSKIMELAPAPAVGGDKSVKVTLYTGVDDPDLPAHVKSLPVGTKSRWVNNYNWGVQDLRDDKEARQQADQYTAISVSDMLEAGIIAAKESGAAAGSGAPVVGTGIPPVQPQPSVTQPVQLGSPPPLSMLDKLMGKRAAPAPHTGLFQVYKGKDGQTRVLLAYSNVFKDKDKEIFSTASHKEYADAAEAGDALYPDLHLWHGGPETKWGVVETVSFVDSFAVAGGRVLPGKEAVALKLKEMADKGELAVSFGYIGLRGPDGVYGLYRPFEISPLPVGSESNPWTDLSFKESGMAFSATKKGWLKEHFNYTDEQIAAAEKGFEGMGAALKAAGVDYKEGAGETPPPAPPDPAPQPPTPAPQPPPPTPSAGAEATMMPQIEALAAAVKGLAEGMVTLASEVKGMKEAQPAAVAASTDASILARIANGPGFSPANAPGNVIPGVKEEGKGDDWLGDIFRGVMPNVENIINGTGGAVLAQTGAPTANGTGSGGEVK